MWSRTEIRKRWSRSVQVSSGDLCGQDPERDDSRCVLDTAGLAQEEAVKEAVPGLKRGVWGQGVVAHTRWRSSGSTDRTGQERLKPPLGLMGQS